MQILFFLSDLMTQYELIFCCPQSAKNRIRPLPASECVGRAAPMAVHFRPSDSPSINSRPTKYNYFNRISFASEVALTCNVNGVQIQAFIYSRHVYIRALFSTARKTYRIHIYLHVHIRTHSHSYIYLYIHEKQINYKWRIISTKFYGETVSFRKPLTFAYL